MNQQQFEQFRTSMIASCDEFLAGGGKLISIQFGSKKDGTCCPIECLGGLEDGGRHGGRTFTQRISKQMEFDIEETEMWQFVDGFDSNPGLRKDDRLSPMYRLGQELRAKYLP